MLNYQDTFETRKSGMYVCMYVCIYLCLNSVKLSTLLIRKDSYKRHAMLTTLTLTFLKTDLLKPLFGYHSNILTSRTFRNNFG